MYKSDSPFLADWFVISLRWLVLLGVVISLALGERLVSAGSLLIALLTIWNITLTWLAGVNRRLNYHRQISLGVDLGISALFFLLEGGLSGPAAWIVILPLISASIYFDRVGAVASSACVILIELLDFFVFHPPFALLASAVVFTLLLGAAFGYLSQQMTQQLRLARQQDIATRERKLRIENDRVRAIYNLTSALTATLDYKFILDSALDLSVNALHVDDPQNADVPLPDDRLISAVLLFHGDHLTVGSARRFTQADLRISLPAKAGLLARVIEEGDSIVTGSVTKDPELGRLVSLYQCKSIYCFPLRSGFNAYGVLIFGHPEKDYFTPDRCEVMDIIGRQAVIAIQNARLYQDLADEKERMIEVQEETRKKLARDLHDGPTQSVAAIAMRVNLTRRMIQKDPASVAEELEKIEELARRTTKEIRHMLFTLRPLVLESQGLTAALQAMAAKVTETYGQAVSIQVDDTLAAQLEMGKSGVIFYLVEEAINNARKHAQAPHIWVSLNPVPRQRDIALLEIGDDGVGFDIDAVNLAYDKRGSLGMVNLRERTELVNGLLHIESTPGKGTRVQVFIPLSEEASDRLHHGRDRAPSQTK